MLPDLLRARIWVEFVWTGLEPFFFNSMNFYCHRKKLTDQIRISPTNYPIIHSAVESGASNGQTHFAIPPFGL